jgi:GDP-mannose 6-dehydrogenase
MKVAVFGLGYVGTVTAACLASRGHEVWGVDVDTDKVNAVGRGHSTVIEPGLDELVAETAVAGVLHASTDPAEALRGAEVSLICVGTPSSANGSTDLSFVQWCTEMIASTVASLPNRADFHTVAVRSTVPPGTVDDIVRPVLDAVGFMFGTAMCPEFLREGSGVADFFNPPFTIIGTSDARVGETLSKLLGTHEQPVHIVETRTAEALKYACNAFHATKVAFANEMARVFRPLGIDSREVMELFCQDQQLNISSSYLRPGFAFGGPCLPKDLRALLHLGRMNSVDLPLLSGTLSSNDVCFLRVVDRVIAGQGMTVAMLGLSFKASSDDLRESPNVRLAETLIGKGYELRIHDPVVNPSNLVGTNRRYVESKLPHLRRLLFDSPVEALDGAQTAIVSSSDASVVAALLAAAPSRTIDLTGRLGSAVEALPGYDGVGW